MKRLSVLVIVLVLLVVLAGCSGAGPKAITEGTLRDTIFSVEPRVNGSVSVWFTHDDVGVYCTYDKALGDKALRILKSHNSEVVATYRSVNNTDPEYGQLFDSATGCGDANKGTTRYKLLSVEAVTGD